VNTSGVKGLNYQNLVSNQMKHMDNQIKEEDDLIDFEMDIQDDDEEGENAIDKDDFFKGPFLTIKNEEGNDVPFKPNKLYNPDTDSLALN